MGLVSDLRILYHLALKPVRGGDHAARLDSFYAGQAEDYDGFRARLLPGREALLRDVLARTPDGGTWVDLGGGTGAALEMGAADLGRLGRVHVVDLSDALLGIARRRIAARGWSNVEAARADVTTWRPPGGRVDAVTFSYALTMIPDWFRAVDNAWTMLRPGGVIGAVDFYVPRAHPAPGRARHGFASRALWPMWFGADGVRLSPDHLPALEWRFAMLGLVEGRARLPYLPFHAPYYRFVGRKREAQGALGRGVTRLGRAIASRKSPESDPATALPPM